MKFKVCSKAHLLSILLFIISCKENPKKTESVNEKEVISMESTVSGIKKSDFEKSVDGLPVSLYVLKNSSGIEAIFTNFGQHLVSLMVPDRNAKLDDVVLGYPTLEGYQKASGKYFGSIIGRYGNRIAKGKFELDGKEYDLAINNGENHLHGGNKGFDSVVWEVDSLSQNFISFHRISPDMEEGYPGNLDVKVTYDLTDDNELKIKYYATTDKRTPVNLTNHSFFNLLGAGNTINTHILEINAYSFNAVDKGLIPTGELLPVQNTPFDFRAPKVIGTDLNSEHPQLKIANGYDHNFILNTEPKNSEGLVFAARLSEPTSGRAIVVFTSEPGIQIYGGNFSDGSTVGKYGKAIDFRNSLCLETQHFPDSPNQKKFPNTILDPGQEYTSTTVYRFSVK